MIDPGLHITYKGYDDLDVAVGVIYSGGTHPGAYVITTLGISIVIYDESAAEKLCEALCRCATTKLGRSVARILSLVRVLTSSK